MIFDHDHPLELTLKIDFALSFRLLKYPKVNTGEKKSLWYLLFLKLKKVYPLQLKLNTSFLMLIF